jgi:hypothetical protein
VPDTGWPALTLAGKLTALARSASADSVIVAVAVLLAGFGSSVEELSVAVTVEVAGRRLGVAHRDRTDVAA